LKPDEAVLAGVLCPFHRGTRQAGVLQFKGVIFEAFLWWALISLYRQVQLAHAYVSLCSWQAGALNLESVIQCCIVVGAWNGMF
jgi:hypothetical protein